MEQKALGTTELTNLVQSLVKDLPNSPDERALQGCAFDVRRNLITKIIEDTVPNNDDYMHQDEQEFYEELLRKSLPSLQIPALKPQSKPSALHTALLAVLGLLFGSALGQGLSAVPSLAFGSGGMVICGILGIVCILWLADYLLQAANKGTIKLPWGVYTWIKARKLFTLSWFGLLGLSLVRDFFAARVGLLHLLESLGAFLNTGNTLNLFTNIYGTLAFVGGIALLLKRPKAFDREDFIQKLEVATQNWWDNASLAAKLLIENNNLINDPTRKEWQQVAREIYSFSAELPKAQQQWLIERLHRLGLETAREEGALIWQQDMLDHYIPLGHIDIGDACYVDEPPILENGSVVKKGTMRKIR